MKLDKILVVRTDKLGDMVLCLPLIQEIARQLPNTVIDVLCRSYTKSLVERHTNVNKAIAIDYDSPAGYFLTVDAISRGEYDAAIVVHPMLDDTLAVTLAGVKYRVGNGYRGYSPLYNRPIYFHRSASDKHELEYNLLFLKGLKLAVPKVAPNPLVEYEEMDEINARNLLSPGIFDNGYIVLHPGSGGSSLNWSLENYTELASRLKNETGFEIVVTGGVNEVIAARKVAQGTGGVCVAGQTDFSALIGILGGAKLFVSGNTGPMHVAAGLGTPCLSFFSPLRSGSPTRWGPRGAPSIVLTPPDLACGRCTGVKCENFNCMQQISVEAAMNSVSELI